MTARAAQPPEVRVVPATRVLEERQAAVLAVPRTTGPVDPRTEGLVGLPTMGLVGRRTGGRAELATTALVVPATRGPVATGFDAPPSVAADRAVHFLPLRRCPKASAEWRFAVMSDSINLRSVNRGRAART